MKNGLNNVRTPVIIISSLIALFYSIYSTYNQINLALSPNQEMSIELKSIFYNVPIIIPALLGLFYFSRKKKLSTLVIRSYMFFLIISILILLLLFTQQDALAFGLPMLLIVSPACIIISVLLIIELFK